MLHKLARKPKISSYKETKKVNVKILLKKSNHVTTRDYQGKYPDNLLAPYRRTEVTQILVDSQLVVLAVHL